MCHISIYGPPTILLPSYKFIKNKYEVIQSMKTNRMRLQKKSSVIQSMKTNRIRLQKKVAFFGI